MWHLNCVNLICNLLNFLFWSLDKLIWSMSLNNVRKILIFLTTKIKNHFYATSEVMCIVMWNKKLKKEKQFTSIQSQKIGRDFSGVHVSSSGPPKANPPTLRRNGSRWKLTHQPPFIHRGKRSSLVRFLPLSGLDKFVITIKAWI